MKKVLTFAVVISFSVINYVVSMRHPRVSDDVSFCFIYSSLSDFLDDVKSILTESCDGSPVF